jgi:DNA polymerase-3 subunit gamma/tau
LPKDAFSEEHLQKIWNDRVNLLFKEKPGILSSLTKHAIILKEEHIIELKLDGQHQLEHLQENRGILIEAIRKDLNNFSIQLETPVKEMVSAKKAYTPKEIYQGMVEENPNLQKLRDELDLDLDY